MMFEDDVVKTVIHYLPQVMRILSFYYNFLVGLDEPAKYAIKYQNIFSNESRMLDGKICVAQRLALEFEFEIYQILGQHDNIIGFLGGGREGIRL
jgi:hypothetical protein